MALWKHRRLTLERMEKFLSSQYFEDVNLYSQLNVSVRPGTHRATARCQTVLG